MEDCAGKPPEGPGPSSARARDLALPPPPQPDRSAEVDRRVSVIKGMMARGEWFTRASRFTLAEEWGCAPSTVKDYAADASRQLRQAKDDAELLEQQEATIGRLERLSAGAEGAGEHRAAIAAEEAKAKVVGLVRAERGRDVLVLVPMGGQELRVSVEALRVLVGALGAALAEAPGDMTIAEFRERVLPGVLGAGGNPDDVGR